MNNLNNPPVTYPGITTQTDVTASRTIGTVYQNTGATALFCNINVNVTTTVTTSVFSDANATPSSVVAQGYNANLSTVGLCLSFWILPGNYYSISAGTKVYWIEWI